MMAITIRDVAKLAGTSTATVSKVINGSPSISDATIERVKKAMKELDYTPNRRAQIFARQATLNIAFITCLERDAAFSNPHMFEIMSGLQAALERKGYTLTLVGVHSDQISLIDAMIAQKSVDGIVIHASVATKNLAQLIFKTHFPHIVIGTPNFKSELCWIDNNNPYSGQMAAGHLIDMGRRRIAFIGGTHEDAISYDRWQGALKTMQERHISVKDEYLKQGNSTHEDGYRMMCELLQLKQRPDSVICANNEIALGCMKALNQKKIAIPQEIAVITFDDYPFSRITDPMLTVVNIDVYDLGVEAGKLILNKIKKPNLQVQSYSTLPMLIVRGSTET
jgi:DNA-binding LacI/PurR family transcriptional regulator